MKFKDIAKHHIGSKVLRPDGKTVLNIDGVIGSLIAHFEDEADDATYSGIAGCKPILFPLSAMTEEQKEDVFQIYQLDDYPNSPTLETQAKVTAYLLRNHFNVFNLPESEFIDASKLENNPYL